MATNQKIDFFKDHICVRTSLICLSTYHFKFFLSFFDKKWTLFKLPQASHGHNFNSLEGRNPVMYSNMVTVVKLLNQALKTI